MQNKSRTLPADTPPAYQRQVVNKNTSQIYWRKMSNREHAVARISQAQETHRYKAEQYSLKNSWRNLARNANFGTLDISRDPSNIGLSVHVGMNGVTVQIDGRQVGAIDRRCSSALVQ